MITSSATFFITLSLLACLCIWVMYHMLRDTEVNEPRDDCFPSSRVNEDDYVPYSEKWEERV